MGAAPASRNTKKMRSGVQGRPLPLSRLLETVETPTLKNMIQTLCERHPELAKEVHELAPRPSVQSALATLGHYESTYRAAFPYGGKSAGDYAYNRVRPALAEMLDALSDYTPNFLPPNENQTSVSMSFLDGATDIIHRLPTWDNPLHNYSRQTAYEEITKAWILVIQEAAKRGAGISLQYGGWENKLAKHNEMSGGRLEDAVNVMRQAVGWADNSSRQRQSGGIGFGMHSGTGVPVRSW